MFFYGSLRHIPLLEIVLGRPVDPSDMTLSRLPGYKVMSAAGGMFPTLIQSQEDWADGLLVRNLSVQDIARLNFYEGGFSYALGRVTLQDGTQAETYLPPNDQSDIEIPWKLETWVAEWGEVTCLAAQEVMGYFGERPADEVAAMFPAIRARAASQRRGPYSRHGARTFKGTADIFTRRRRYSGFFALDDVALRHQKFDGLSSDLLNRAAFISADAALVLPYDPVTDRVLLVEQFRVGPFLRHDQAPWQLEPIAGRIDAGETPEAAARRESFEEAGLALDALETVAEVYPSPGGSTEFFYIFVGLADLSKAKSEITGLASEHEDIKTHILSFDALMTLAADFAVANAPLALCAYWLAYHRDRLRSERGEGTPSTM
ncbi:MAG: NUDIX domain-containing protein [Pseudomonadota bacterium]